MEGRFSGQRTTPLPNLSLPRLLQKPRRVCCDADDVFFVHVVGDVVVEEKGGLGGEFIVGVPEGNRKLESGKNLEKTAGIALGNRIGAKGRECAAKRRNAASKGLGKGTEDLPPLGVFKGINAADAPEGHQPA